jgi:prepilin-type N-terminal cleavage/methylation domain-containing protein
MQTIAFNLTFVGGNLNCDYLFPFSPMSDSSKPRFALFRLARSKESAWPFAVPTGAFSLIELLVVVAVMGLLASLTVPALNSIGSARGSIDAAYKISDAIELARSEAVARRSFVWLGFENATNFGNRNLKLGAVYSKDGSTNISAANLQPLFRPILLDRVGLVAVVATGTNSTKYSDATSLANNSAGASFSVGSQAFVNNTITFTPTGEAMLTGLPNATTGFEPQILIGLRGFRGSTEATNNDIAVVVDGSAGIPTIFRKQ